MPSPTSSIPRAGALAQSPHLPLPIPTRLCARHSRGHLGQAEFVPDLVPATRAAPALACSVALQSGVLRYCTRQCSPCGRCRYQRCPHPPPHWREPHRPVQRVPHHRLSCRGSWSRYLHHRVRRRRLSLKRVLPWRPLTPQKAALRWSRCRVDQLRRYHQHRSHLHHPKSHHRRSLPHQYLPCRRRLHLSSHPPLPHNRRIPCRPKSRRLALSL